MLLARPALLRNRRSRSGLRKSGESVTVPREREEWSRGAAPEAESKRVEFESKIVKHAERRSWRVQLRGGAAMWSRFFSRRDTGAPQWISAATLPRRRLVFVTAFSLLPGIQRFMIALAAREVARVVREIRGLLPAGEAA